MSAWLCSLVNGLKHQRVAVLSAMLSLPMLSTLSVNVYANEQAPTTTEATLIDSETSDASSTKATYVGSEACVDCHSEEVEAWQGSHHDMAMKHATMSPFGRLQRSNRDS